MKTNLSRRVMLGAAALVGTGRSSERDQLALLGGQPVRKQPFPKWPRFDGLEESSLLRVLRSGKWYRGSGKEVEQFEAAYARLTGSRHCIATANGTSALYCSLNGLGIGPGDEVIVPPYTFVATINVVLAQYALPVFVDSDIDTFQIDPDKIDAAVTKQTAAVMPVHLGGNVADMDKIRSTTKRRSLKLIEDACQAHLAEWKGQKVGTLGDTGCFSFQASKNLNSGEGGAVLCQDDDVMASCFAFHGNGRPWAGHPSGAQYKTNGANLRLTEFQGALLRAQMSRLDRQAGTREGNAEHLTRQINEIPGIQAAKMYAGCTRNAYHLYMFRYDREQFRGVPKSKFLEALRAEGIPASGGYRPLNREPFLLQQLQSKGFRRVFPEKVLAEWKDRTECPANDRLCDEAIWLSQTTLLGPRSDMDQIASAIRKIQRQSSDLHGNA